MSCPDCAELEGQVRILTRNITLMKAPPQTWPLPKSAAISELKQDIAGLEHHLKSCERLRAADRATVLKQRAELTALRIRLGEAT